MTELTPDDKRKLLAEILAQKSAAALVDTPLSVGQHALWFQHQKAPDSAAYNVCFAARIVSPVDLMVLQQAFDRLAERHPILRTSYPDNNGTPFMRTQGAHKPTLRHHDTTDLTEEDLFEKVYGCYREPFDIQQGPIFRVDLFSRSEDDHVLLFTIHHIACDGWTMGVLLRDLKAFCETPSQQQLAVLPPVSGRYTAFVQDQRNLLNSEEGDRLRKYWTEQLAGEIPVLDLPLIRPRPSERNFRGATHTFEIQDELFQPLKALAKSENTTLYAVLLSAFQVLLTRYSGQTDVPVGTPVAGRSRTDYEQVAGLFINQVVMRGDLSGDLTFRQYLQRNRRTIIDALEHQAYPFPLLVQNIQPHRDQSCHPIYQVLFNLLKQSSLGTIDSLLDGTAVNQPMDFGPFKFKPYLIAQQEGQFDLALEMLYSDNRLNASFRYSTDILDESTVTRMSGHFQHLLARIVDNPDLGVFQLSMESSTERTAFYRITGLDPASDLPAIWTGMVAGRVDEHARRTPENIALVADTDIWNYRELELAANQIANLLSANGIAQRDIVAVYGHRSAGLVLSLLGIHKAGAAFLILDAAYPLSRLHRMAEAARPAGLILLETAGDKGQELRKGCESFGCRYTLAIPRGKKAQRALFKKVPNQTPPVAIGPDDPAYVVFTSGTTGEPKGVVGTHRPLSHFIDWHCRTFELMAADRFSMMSGLSHDPLLRDIFTPFWVGAALCIPQSGGMLVPEQLRQWMHNLGITVVHLTPAMSQVLTEGCCTASDVDGDLQSLRLVFFGGDLLTRQHIQRVRSITSEVVCVNYYGTTETPQAMGYYVVDGVDASGSTQTIPLGYGIEGVQLLLLNPAGQMAAVGELGEIHVRTPYLSRGYLNDNHLTESRYIRNPFTGVDGDRLYKTGDLGRYLPNGAVLFHGRRDKQVSIRGFRIELGEIEANLKEMAAISDCVAVLLKDRRGEHQLAVYFVAAQGQDETAIDFRGFLRTRLPDYMVPQHYLPLKALPLTPNGKVDYARLPGLPERQVTSDLPRTLLETQLMVIWENVLGVNGIGLKDNFFDLGGHSLIALRLLTQMEKVFGRQFPLSTVFQAQTIEDMAAAMLEDSLEFGGSIVAIQAGGTRPPIFVVPGIGGSALGYSELSRLLGADQPVYCLQSLGLDGTQKPLERIEDIAENFAAEIRKVQPQGPYRLVGFCWGGAVAYEIAQQLTAQGQMVNTLAMIQTFPPEGSVVTYKAPPVVHKVAFVIRGAFRYLSTFKEISPKKWVTHFKAKSRVVREMVQTRDIYRGDRTQLYRDMVQNANLRAFSRYVPEKYKGAIIFIMPSNRDIMGRKDPSTFWGELAEHGMTYLQLEGEDSGSLLKAPNVQHLADLLASHLSHIGPSE